MSRVGVKSGGEWWEREKRVKGEREKKRRRGRDRDRDEETKRCYK